MTRVLDRTIATSIAAVLALALFATGCGSDGSDDLAGVEASEPVESTVDTSVEEASMDDDGDEVPTPDPDATATPEPPRPDDAPIPVEADGGIGDGAGPIPGSEDNAPLPGDWHGAELAITNCPGTDFQRVEASTFSFSVPVDFVNEDAQGIDSEVGIWTAEGIEVLYDYGWYSAPLIDLPGAEVTPISYSGFEGNFVVVRDPAGLQVGVHFPVVVPGEFQADRLTLTVRHDRAEDEIIGRCIVGSIEWKVPLVG